MLGYQDSNLEIATDQGRAGCRLPYTPLCCRCGPRVQPQVIVYLLMRGVQVVEEKLSVVEVVVTLPAFVHVTSVVSGDTAGQKSRIGNTGEPLSRIELEFPGYKAGTLPRCVIAASLLFFFQRFNFRFQLPDFLSLTQRLKLKLRDESLMKLGSILKVQPPVLSFSFGRQVFYCDIVIFSCHVRTPGVEPGHPSQGTATSRLRVYHFTMRALNGVTSLYSGLLNGQRRRHPPSCSPECPPHRLQKAVGSFRLVIGRGFTP
jgi:hypothetical protein